MLRTGARQGWGRLQHHNPQAFSRRRALKRGGEPNRPCQTEIPTTTCWRLILTYLYIVQRYCNPSVFHANPNQPPILGPCFPTHFGTPPPPHASANGPPVLLSLRRSSQLCGETIIALFLVAEQPCFPEHFLYPNMDTAVGLIFQTTTGW